ncbi:MAG: hypothetical protein QJR09_04800 [Micrococcus sp.]|nr:hypothetical protein [Micrococcus sp.]
MNHRPFPRGVRVADAERFVYTRGRLLERRRLDLLLHGGGPEGVLAALGAYRNPDGGFGHGLEPDVRSPVSESLSTLAALDLLAGWGLADHPWFRSGLEWAASVSGLDGSLPFVTEASLAWPHAPWVQPAPEGSHVTFGFAAAALRTGFTGGWATAAVAWCRSRVADPGLSAYAVKYALRFLAADRRAVSDPASDAAITGWRARLDRDGALPVEGGADGERLHPWDLAADPWTAREGSGPAGEPARRLFTGKQLHGDLDRVILGQQADGGWHVDWPAWCPGQGLDWRGIRTVEVLQLLADADRS